MLLSHGLQAQSSDPYARDLIQLVEFFEGEFDNDSQLWFENRSDWPGDDENKHKRLHAIHTKVNLPEFGEHIFYVEEYIDDDPENVIRQRIVHFYSDIEAGGIVQKLYFLKDAKKYLHAHMDMDLLQKIKLDEVMSLESCNVIFKREGDQFFGQMEEKKCQFGEGEKQRYSVHDIHLSSTKYWRTDQSYLLANDELYSGNASNEPHKMRKAQNYICDISFTEKGYYDPSGNDKKYEKLIVHNQGGKVEVHDPIKDKNYILQLREKEYPFYKDGSDFFMLRFIEKDATRSEVIVTTEPNTKKISFSLGWSSASCKIQD